VEAHDLVGPLRRVGDLGDREPRRVGREDRVARRHRVELGEHLVLDRHLLGHGLDREVHGAEAVVLRRAGDVAQDPAHLRLALLLGELALVDELVGLVLRHLAGLLEPGVDEPPVDVLEDDGDVCRCDDLRDLAAHDAGADDRGLEHEHGLDPSGS
jgi:hypothetical protein